MAILIEAASPGRVDNQATRPERQGRERSIVEQLSQLFPVFTLVQQARNN
jgi:hypothetical protein